jgi:tRNA-2-methylthio-N6-dimethylallyladenosine synthase
LLKFNKIIKFNTNNMLYHLIVLGCQMNISDSERVRSVIEQMGFTHTDKEEDAHLLGVLSCSVRQKPIDKVYSRIYKWNRIKAKRNVLTFVSGCVLPDDREKFLKLFDFVFPMSELNDFPKMMKEYGVASPLSLQTTDAEIKIEDYFNQKPVQSAFKPVKIAAKNSKTTLPSNKDIFQLWKTQPNYQSDFEAFVPIQNGCDKFCSYCAVPYTRGREVSRPSAEIVEEVVQLMKTGFKSITLLGQNVNSYGLDCENEILFAQLLEAIGKEGEKLNDPSWVYCTSPHPRDMRRDVVESIAKYKTLGKQIHLPLQSGSDQVLVKMNRKHNLDRYRESIQYIKELVPQATLFTDIIVGFTGETEEQFQSTMNSFDEFKFNMAYIAMYSPRPGAQSFRWEDDIPKETKKDRLKRLSEKLENISLHYNQELMGKEMTILVRTTERKTGYLSGHNEGKIVTRIISKDPSLIGQFVKIKVTEVSGFSISGELVENTAVNSRKTIEAKV